MDLKMRRTCKKLDDSIMASGFLDSFDYVLCDCDGVLWHGPNPIPGSIETVQALHKMGKHIIYITNNSTKAREEYLEKCAKFGLPGKVEDIMSTSYCVAAYLKSKHFQRKVYVLGSTGITFELQKAGIDHLPVGPDPVPEDWVKWIPELKLDPEVGAVVVGFDHYISYPKLTKAASYLRDPETLFIATNRDEQFPTERNLTIPGAGTFVAAVETVSGRTAVSLGKPHKYMFDCIKEMHPDIDVNKCVMIGDRLNTDIMFGTKHGIKTLLVLTGINSLEDVHEYEKGSQETDQLLIPDYYLTCLGDLQQFIKV
ncbi:glycerol-3-phosphate phosphatase-like [Uloborus diversus]|uniref:glycerol-3-phosphate phosphatase-like n=1 Tax=Uloborus diversus TaxID=327109 RepID=UPI0024092C86|nr:glycerol-3-phosphate phosphatase-like [Uloborus diversus]